MLIIERLREQVSGLEGILAQCQAQLIQSGLESSPLFWVLVAFSVLSFSLGSCRVLWHSRHEGFFIVDRYVGINFLLMKYIIFVFTTKFLFVGIWFSGWWVPLWHLLLSTYLFNKKGKFQKFSKVKIILMILIPFRNLIYNKKKLFDIFFFVAGSSSLPWL